jgi:hypothetical protein
VQLNLDRTVKKLKHVFLGVQDNLIIKINKIKNHIGCHNIYIYIYIYIYILTRF